MLSYEDSKRLKELGYPQELKEGDWVYLSDGLGPVCVHTPWWYEDIPYVRVPTTDGMIEGLGDDFFLLKNGPAEFTKEGDKPLLVAMGVMEEGTRYYCEGRTPDQALCRLWKEVKG